MALNLNTLALALLILSAVCFNRRRHRMLLVSGALFFPVAAAATLACWWPLLGLAAAIAVLALTLGASLLLLALLLIDVTLAPFCLEMTYPALLCWVLCPLAVGANYLALVLT